MKINNIIKEEISKYILSEDFNYHKSGGVDIIKNNIPYASETRAQMTGNRDTGYFGSGTYFSTYKGNNYQEKYNPNNDFNYPYLVRIDNGLYRVDLDIYNNLYKVDTEQEGNLLFTTLRSLHIMFNNIENNEFDNSLLYQKIYKNCNALGLNCPNYMKLTRMMQEYSKSDNVQTFQTYFMELNGFNGVNVSGIDFFDNTTHGSVVYNLNKNSVEPVTINKNIKGTYSPHKGFKQASAENTIAKNNPWTEDTYEKSLFGDKNMLYNLSNYNSKEQRRIVLNFINNNKLLSYDELHYFNEDVIRFYMKYLFMHKPTINDWDFEETFNNLNLRKVIDEYDLYYWVNIEFKYSNILNNMLYMNTMFEDREYREKYLNKLLSYMKRPLNNKEKNYIENEYYNED